MRLAVLLALVLALRGAARAEDDDGLLDTRPLGQAIPERLQTLEREWADDVGTKEPVDATDDAAEEPHEPEPFEDDAEPPPKPHPSAEEPVPVKPKSALPERPAAPARRGVSLEHPGGPAPKGDGSTPEKPGPPPTRLED